MCDINSTKKEEGKEMALQWNIHMQQINWDPYYSHKVTKWSLALKQKTVKLLEEIAAQIFVFLG